MGSDDHRVNYLDVVVSPLRRLRVPGLRPDDDHGRRR